MNCELDFYVQLQNFKVKNENNAPGNQYVNYISCYF
jgi:hypothetical protein